MKEEIRIATIKAYVLKPRCRKEQLIYLEGHGKDDNLAFLDLQYRIEQKRSSYKTFVLDETYETYSAQRETQEGVTWITRQLFHRSDSLVRRSYEEAVVRGSPNLCIPV